MGRNVSRIGTVHINQCHNCIADGLCILELRKPRGTKVILTVRDDEQKWWNSWKKFIVQEYERVQVMGISYQDRILDRLTLS